MPVNIFVPNLLMLLRRARLGWLAQHREKYQGIELLDSHISGLMLRGKQLEAPRKGLLRTVMSAGIASQKSMYDAGLTEQQQCPWCGAADVTADHIVLWCQHPRFQAARTKFSETTCPDGFPQHLWRNLLSDILQHRIALPPCLANYGLAPALAAGIDEPWWPGSGLHINERRAEAQRAGAWDTEACAEWVEFRSQHQHRLAQH
eukprot:15439266-Alexandrium_andersonii.AAC.1